MPDWKTSSRLAPAIIAFGALCMAACGPDTERQARRQADILSLDARATTRLLKAGDLSAEEVVRAYLQRAAARRHLNAWITLDEAGALAAARRIDRALARGDDPGLLAGLPLAVKDNIHVRGMPNTAGTPALESYVPAADAQVVKRLREQGAIVIGKTNLHELALGITTNNAYFGAAANPRNPRHSPGGSSGGAGAAVADFQAPLGLGTDTGGSVRIPASFTGIYGLRPTIRRYPGDAITPISSSRDTPGPLARSVADLILLDAAVMGYRPVFDAPSPADIRLGVPRNFFYEDLDGEIQPVIDAALARLEERGVTLLRIDYPDMIETLERIGFLMVANELSPLLTEYLAEYTDIDLEELRGQIASPDVRELFGVFHAGVDAKSARDYQRALREEVPALRARFHGLLEAHALDAILIPAVTVAPPPIAGSDATIRINGEDRPTFLTITRNAGPASVLGAPALVFPVGKTAAGLPVGMEITGVAGADRALLRIALTFEAIFGHLEVAEAGD